MLPLNEQKQQDEQAHDISYQWGDHIPLYLLYYVAHYIWVLLSVKTHN